MLDRAKLSNGDVADALGVAVETVSRWRKGATMIDDDSLRRVVALLADRGIRVTMGWMRYGEIAAAFDLDPELDRKLSPAEETRAIKLADEKSARKRKGKKGGGRRQSGERS